MKVLLLGILIFLVQKAKNKSMPDTDGQTSVGHDDCADIAIIPDPVPRGVFKPVKPMGEPTYVAFDLETSDLSVGHDDCADIAIIPDPVPRGVFKPVKPMGEPTYVAFDLETSDLKLVLPHFATIGEEETRWRRSTSGVFKFPERLVFSVEINNASVTIALLLSNVNYANPPLYEFHDGKVTELFVESPQNQAMYQDVNTAAAYIVSCDGPTQQQCALHGSFYFQHTRYHMTPHLSFATSGLHEINEIEAEERMFEDDAPLPPESANNENRRVERHNAEPIRSKRDADDVNIVEFLAITDESVFQNFRQKSDSNDTALAAIQVYYALLINEIDLHYLSVRRVDSSLQIRVALAGVIIAMSGAGAQWSSNNTVERNGTYYLDASYALKSFTLWRNSHRNQFPSHDHAMAFTMKQFEFVYADSVSGGLAGAAYISQVCRSYSASITEDNGWRTATVAAHELGHSLGAYHDQPTTCPSSLNTIMTSSISTTTSAVYAEAQWTFSNCSVAAFNRHIDGLNTNCMKEHTMNISGFISSDVSRALPGEFYSLDQQCQMTNGPESRACVPIVPEGGCSAGIRCDSRGCGYGSYMAYYPLAGSACVNSSGDPSVDHWCYRGLCLQKPAITTPLLDGNPCKARCCKIRGKRKKCCVGIRCCRKSWGRTLQCCLLCKKRRGQ